MTARGDKLNQRDKRNSMLQRQFGKKHHASVPVGKLHQVCITCGVLWEIHLALVLVPRMVHVLAQEPSKNVLFRARR